MKKLVTPVVMLVLAASLIGCSSMTPGQKQAVGIVGGAAAGGIIGNAVTGGSAVGTVGGAAGGAYLGHVLAN